jgi:Bacterial PH domain
MVPSKYLAEGEELVLEVRRHWLVLAEPLASAVGVIFLAGAVGLFVSPNQGSDAIDTIVGLAALGFAFRFAWKLGLWWVDRIIVTDRRVIEASGVVTRKVASMPLTKITDMTYVRPFTGRIIFRYGHLVLESAGQTQALDEIKFLRDPDNFYKAVITRTTHRFGLPPEPRPTGEPRVREHDDTGPIPRVR